MEVSDLKARGDEGGLVMRLFGPNTKLVLAFLARLSDLSPEDFATVANAWRQTDGRDRAEAWAQLHRATQERERYRILAAASVARQGALDTASSYHWSDWEFWAAASDAAAAIAARDRIGRHYQVLISPLAAIMPWLLPGDGEVQSGEAIAASHLPSDDVLQQGA
jgi:hypothetical protein